MQKIMHEMVKEKSLLILIIFQKYRIFINLQINKIFFEISNNNPGWPLGWPFPPERLDWPFHPDSKKNLKYHSSLKYFPCIFEKN